MDLGQEVTQFEPEYKKIHDKLIDPFFRKIEHDASDDKATHCDPTEFSTCYQLRLVLLSFMLFRRL
jgi:hypothetical protein